MLHDKKKQVPDPSRLIGKSSDDEEKSLLLSVTAPARWRKEKEGPHCLNPGKDPYREVNRRILDGATW